jgi:hypothetical protein
MNNSLKYLVLLLSAILALFSFSISYTALATLALINGIYPAELFPLIIDGIIILALVWRLYGNDTDMARLVMGSYVVMSIGFNALSHGSVVSALMAAIAPISLYITSEICASMINQKIIPKNRDEKGRFKKVE